MTQAAIDAVFADERYRSKFTSPRRDKAICEEQTGGETILELDLLGDGGGHHLKSFHGWFCREGNLQREDKKYAKAEV